MKTSAFNSLDQALAKAELQKRQSEKARTPIYLIVGLDFGTAYTKCMVRDFNYRRAVPISFDIDGEATFFVPSELGWRRGNLIHPLDGVPEGTQVLSFLKMALAAAALGISSDWLDGVIRPLGIADSHRQMESVRALVVLYIARVLQAVKCAISERWKDFGQIAGDAVFYNMAVPAAQARDEAVLNAFRECLNAAVIVMRAGSEVPQDLSLLIPLVDHHRGTRLDICDVMPEVTANVQSYVRSRAGQHGLYLFADVGAGTVDYSVFIYYPQGGVRALTYPHATVEHLGSSQLEMRAFQRSHAAITRQLRLLKEGISRDGEWRMNLSKELKTTRDELQEEITGATQRVVALTRRKLRRGQFQTMQILYGGGGWTQIPYASGIEAAFDSRWGLSPVSQPLPVPNDVDWPAHEGAKLFRRFSVAYGLSFLPTDQPIQRFPDEIDELDPDNRPKRQRVEALSKDEV
jgi:hypothetical protein